MSRYCSPGCASVGRVRRLEARVAVLEALVESLGGKAPDPEPLPIAPPPPPPPPPKPAPVRKPRLAIRLDDVPSEMERLAESWRKQGNG